MESEQTHSDWFGYECKSGEILFYYNVKTGEHRWANNVSVFITALIHVCTVCHMT
jgi:hypothetical protein